MERLLERIRRDGRILRGNILCVDSFLNHQMDVSLFAELGREFHRRFESCNVTKILTVEASGIGIACITAQSFCVPVVFAKKKRVLSEDVYTAQVASYTHAAPYSIMVSKEFLCPSDRILLLDDFLANGSALLGLSQLVSDAGAALVGAGVVIEKAFQPGGARVRSQGIRVESLARIASMDPKSGISFCKS